MKGLWLEAGKLSFNPNLPDPVAEAGEALVAVRRVGICGTDLALLSGYAGFSGVPGHELVGDVVAGPEEWRNARVTAEINVACGRCDLCQAGLANHCTHREVLGIRDHGGAFAELVSVPVTNLWRIPASLTDEQAVLIEPLAAALQITEQVAIAPDTRVLLIGAGRLGQLIAQVLLASGTVPEILIRTAARRHSFAGLGGQLVDEPRGHYDLVVDASGSAAGLQQALASVRPRGTIVLKSTWAGLSQVDFSALVVNEISLVGSRCGPFGRAIAWLAEGRIRTGHLRMATYSLEAHAAAFARAAEPDIYKVMFRP
ncbi:MAG: alcohol dehydrogenase catalytic domain-containing protein [Pseudomonadota bacterium]